MRTSEWGYTGVSLPYLKNCLVIKSCLEAVVFKQIWYKTGSQWPGEFSHLGTRSENVLSAQSSKQANKTTGGAALDVKALVGSLSPGFFPAELCVCVVGWGGVSPHSPKPRIRLFIYKLGASGREMGGKCKKPPVSL